MFHLRFFRLSFCRIRFFMILCQNRLSTKFAFFSAILSGILCVFFHHLTKFNFFPLEDPRINSHVFCYPSTKFPFFPRFFDGIRVFGAIFCRISRFFCNHYTEFAIFSHSLHEFYIFSPRFFDYILVFFAIITKFAFFFQRYLGEICFCHDSPMKFAFFCHPLSEFMLYTL